MGFADYFPLFYQEKRLRVQLEQLELLFQDSRKRFLSASRDSHFPLKKCPIRRERSASTSLQFLNS